MSKKCIVFLPFGYRSPVTLPSGEYGILSSINCHTWLANDVTYLCGSVVGEVLFEGSPGTADESLGSGVGAAVFVGVDVAATTVAGTGF